MTHEQLNDELEKLKKGEYVYISYWVGGQESGFTGYLVDFFETWKIYKFICSGKIENEEYISKATLKEVSIATNKLKETLLNALTEENVMSLNEEDCPQIADVGTTIEFCLNGMKKTLKNLNKEFSNGKYDVYENLRSIIESGILLPDLKDLKPDELLKLRKLQIQRIKETINGKELIGLEGADSNIVQFNLKLILEHIKYIDSKLANKFKGQFDSKVEEQLLLEYDKLEKENHNYKNMEELSKIVDSLIEL